MSKFILLFFVAIFFTLISCGGQNKSLASMEQTKDKTSSLTFGWFNGSCFATTKSNLRAETEILVIVLGDPQSISSAKVVEPAKVQDCPPLSSDRRERNESEGLRFYKVKSDQIFNLAIGVVGNVSRTSILGGVVHLDLDNDGTFERFTHCATSDGISFDIWGSRPYEQKPIWSGFYYLGYDVERNCP